MTGACSTAERSAAKATITFVFLFRDVRLMISCLSITDIHFSNVLFEQPNPYHRQLVHLFIEEGGTDNGKGMSS
jgi:hypothetical protein